MENDNSIIQAPFQFRLLSSNFQNWSYKDVNKNDSLVVLKKLDLTKAFDAAVAAVATAAGWAAVATAYAAATTAGTGTAANTARAGAAYWKIRDQAKEEFIKTGKIKGYEVLNLRTMDRLWISHYDIQLLSKIA